MRLILKEKRFLLSTFPVHRLRVAFSGDSPYKRLFENFLSLSTLQALNYILPLLTVPYLVRVLGPEKYGLISFVQALVGYFAIFTDYGFGLSATREISIHREDKDKVSEIFSAVLVVKCIFGALSFLAFVFIVAGVSRFRPEWVVYMFSFITILGNILFPVWFFQGIERMKYITLLNAFSRGIFTACIFVFIKRQTDYPYVPLISSIGAVTAGWMSLRIAFKTFGVKFRFPTTEALVYQIKEGWYIFISTVAISLYTVSNTFLLGLFTNNTIVGYYAAAEKIIRAVLGLLSPVSQTLYPYVSKLASESRERALGFARKALRLIGSGTLLVSILLFLFAPLIVSVVLGKQYLPSIIVLRVLACIPFVVGLSNVFGIQIMLTLGLKKQFSKVITSAGVLNVIMSLILIPLWHHAGVAVAWLITETFVTVTMFLSLRRMGIRMV